MPRTDPDDEPTQPIPIETLAEVARQWREQMAKEAATKGADQ